MRIAGNFLRVFILIQWMMSVAITSHSEESTKSIPEQRTLSSEQLAKHLTEAITQEFPNEQGEFKVTLLRPQPAITIPEGTIEVTLTGLPTTSLRSRIMLKYELKVGGQLIRTESIPTEVQVLKEVLVSTRRINRGEPLELDDLSLEIRNVIGLQQNPVDPASDVSMYEINYTVMRGKVLTERNIRKKPVVDRGDIVTGWLRRGLLQINLKVEVMEEAAPGQLVRVRNIKTKKNLRGIVYDENSILIP